MGILHTFTLSEPILAKAAMELRCYEKNRSNSIGTFPGICFSEG